MLNTVGGLRQTVAALPQLSGDEPGSRGAARIIWVRIALLR